MTSTTALQDQPSRTGGLPRLFKPLSIGLWVVALAFATVNYALDPTSANLLLLCVFVLLCIAINAESRVRSFARGRALRREAMRLDNSFYIDEEIDLPNRTYLLGEVRREIARSATSKRPFSLVHLSLNQFDAVRQRRGEEFATLALGAMTNLLRRVTRETDFLAHLGGTVFVVLLVDAGEQESAEFLRSAIPGWISVSNGSSMLDIPIVARTLEYDLDGLYSADILHDLEQAPARMREQRPMTNLA